MRLISNPSRQGVITEIIDRAEGNTVLVFFAGGEEAYVNAEDLELVWNGAMKVPLTDGRGMGSSLAPGPDFAVLRL